MSLNLLQSIRQNLGYPELQKIDPNTGQENLPDGNENELAQAAIPALIISLYKYTRGDEGAEKVLCNGISQQWLPSILGAACEEAVANVAEYANSSKEKTSHEMELIAKEAIRLIRENSPVAVNDVKTILAAEKNNALLYLPPGLHLGDLLNDTTIDDKTHKMEGPVSSFMNALGNAFSPSEKSKNEEQ